MKHILLFFALVIFVGCVSGPHHLAVSGQQSGSWTAKAQVRELKTGKTQNVNMEILAIWPDRLRIDATATLGLSVATLALHDNQFQLLLPRQKKFFEGKASDKALENLFKIPINPNWLLNITFDQPLHGWQCQSSESGQVESCSREADGLSVIWTDRDGTKKRVIIKNATHEVQILYKDYSDLNSTKVQSENDPFILTAPENYTRHNVN